MPTKSKATIEDLYRVEGKAELVNGEIVHMPPTGYLPGYAGDEIFFSLRAYLKENKIGGIAVGDNKGFRVNLPGRESFSPDAAYYSGKATGMKFFEGSPSFAVEIRSENDYGPKAEREIAVKRADYFAAGTLVVWDVDLLSLDVIKSYNHNDPDKPKIYRRSEIADAEPAVPGWIMKVDDLFD
jgi:Uma2 family endonuclease